MIPEQQLRAVRLRFQANVSQSQSVSEMLTPLNRADDTALLIQSCGLEARQSQKVASLENILGRIVFQIQSIVL